MRTEMRIAVCSVADNRALCQCSRRRRVESLAIDCQVAFALIDHCGQPARQQFGEIVVLDQQPAARPQHPVDLGQNLSILFVVEVAK